MNGLEDQERLKELIGRLCDDRINAEGIQELEAILADDPVATQYYVESVDLHARLQRRQGVTTATTETEPPSLSPSQQRWRPLILLATAVCVSLVLGTFAGMRFSSSRPAASNVVPSQAIATLSSATGCRWSEGDGARYEGQRLAGELLRLESGIAMVRFDSDVTLIIEGPTELDLVSVSRARLRKGKAVFSGMTDLDAFTLETPFSTILDEGTEYAVSVDPAADAMEVHVFDGRVQCDGRGGNQSPIRVDAGQARRFASRGSDVSIPLAASRFTRKPAFVSLPQQGLMLAESFNDEGILDGKEGGIGWADRWQQLNIDEANASTTVLAAESIAWAGRPVQTDGGSLQVAGKTSLSRKMARPIRMNRDAAYYLSFLVRKQKVETADQPSPTGWAFLTLRDPSGNKIAISPLAQRGTPKLIHNGRTANASMKLQGDSVYLFVAKILAQRDKRDQVFVHVYSAEDTIDSVEPLTWAFATPPMDDDSVFDQIRIVSQASQPIQIDDLRIGRTWGLVVSDYQSRRELAFLP